MLNIIGVHIPIGDFDMCCNEDFAPPIEYQPLVRCELGIWTGKQFLLILSDRH